MNVNFAVSNKNSVFRFPWINNTYLFFTINTDPILLKAGDASGFKRQNSCYFVGPRLLNDTVDFGKHCCAVGIIFKPGGFQRLMGIPVVELTNKEVDAVSVFGNEVSETEMRLKESRSNEEVKFIIEHFLLNKLKKVRAATPFDQAIEELLISNGNLTVEEIAKYACLSYRQVERKCFEKLGMNAKLFAKITRFNKAYALKEANPQLSWTKIAHKSGYYDQSHFIKDFKTFAGLNPNAIIHQLDSSVKIMAALDGAFLSQGIAL